MIRQNISKMNVAIFAGLVAIFIASTVTFSILYAHELQSSVVNVDNSGNTSINPDALEDTINDLPYNDLSDQEKQGIIYMREEEKLAHDVYSVLYEKWQLKIFNNIANSEQTHMDAVKVLLDKYNLTDPATNKGIGEFYNQTLQNLYDQLVELGSKSLVDALKVGAAIEEIDIIDLQDYKEQTTYEDIILVYDLLMMGSRNHLRAFVSTLAKNGVTYEPQYLSNDEYTDIINGDVESPGKSNNINVDTADNADIYLAFIIISSIALIATIAFAIIRIKAK